MSKEAKRGETWKHVKTGRLYEIIDYAELQTAYAPLDEKKCVIYRGATGLWVRPSSEFHDGRFVRETP